MRLSVSFVLIFLEISLVASQKILSCQVNGATCTFNSKVTNENEVLTILTENSAGLDEGITSVKFDSSSIYSVPRELFTTFVNLERLDMEKQNVRKIEDKTFPNARKLIYLRLSHSKIKSLDQKTFEGLENLKELFITWSGIQEIHKDTFKKLINLETLDLGGNKVKIYHKDIFKSLSHLKIFSIAYNPFEFLHKDTFRNNQELVHLNLNGADKLGGLSNRMFSHLVNLDRLYLNGIGCIKKEYNPKAYSQIQTIENDLRNCLISYLSYENDEILEKIENLQSEIKDLSSNLYQIMFKLSDDVSNIQKSLAFNA